MTKNTDDHIESLFERLRELERRDAPAIARPDPATARRRPRRWALVPLATAASVAVATMVIVLTLMGGTDDMTEVDDAVAAYDAVIDAQQFVMDDFMVACDCLVPSLTPVPGSVRADRALVRAPMILESI